MTFDEKELDNAINKIIVTSLFSCLSDTQQKQFYESAFNMIERCCFCDADELPEKSGNSWLMLFECDFLTNFLKCALRIWTNRKRPFPFRV